jgi:hypothetical protein
MSLGPPGPAVFRHVVEHVRDLAGCLYGRRISVVGEPGFACGLLGAYQA